MAPKTSNVRGRKKRRAMQAPGTICEDVSWVQGHQQQLLVAVKLGLGLFLVGMHFLALLIMHKSFKVITHWGICSACLCVPFALRIILSRRWDHTVYMAPTNLGRVAVTAVIYAMLNAQEEVNAWTSVFTLRKKSDKYLFGAIYALVHALQIALLTFLLEFGELKDLRKAFGVVRICGMVLCLSSAIVVSLAFLPGASVPPPTLTPTSPPHLLDWLLLSNLAINAMVNIQAAVRFVRAWVPRGWGLATLQSLLREVVVITIAAILTAVDQLGSQIDTTLAWLADDLLMLGELVLQKLTTLPGYRHFWAYVYRHYVSFNREERIIFFRELTLACLTWLICAVGVICSVQSVVRNLCIAFGEPVPTFQMVLGWLWRHATGD